jgi:leucine dehydrogenase
MDARILDYMQQHRFKKLVMCNDTDSGLRAVIAIHSTALGPACGGLRMWTYADEQDAIFDALRLARGMTYKYAAAGVDLGGGKAVIIGDPKVDKSEALMRAMGRFIDQLGGEYMTGEDVGTTLQDMETLHSETDHVITLPVHAGGAGDISPATALSSVLATQACALRVWGDASLKGRTVALQGLGVCGSKALKLLVDQGARVTVTDVDPAKVAAAVAEYGVEACAPDEIYSVAADIFAPYALGAVINDATIERLKVKVVAGSANNILAEDRHGDELQARGITYAVDYVANSGGTIFDTDRYRKGGFQSERAWANVRRVYDRTLEVFAIADRDNVPFYKAADRIAEARIDAINKVRLLDTNFKSVHR